MDNFSLFQYFGVEEPQKEETKKEETKKPSSSKASKKDAKKTSGKDKKNNPILDGPLTFIGRGFKKVLGIDSQIAKPLTVWLEELYNEGFKEASIESATCIVVDKTVYLATPDTPSMEDTAIMADQFYIVDGQLQISFSMEEQFAAFSKDEVSVLDVLDKLESMGNSAFHGCSLHYDCKAKVGIPLYDKVIKTEIPLPVSMLTFGEVVEYRPEAFMGKETILLSELDNFLVSGEEVNVSYQRRQDGVLVPCFRPGKNCTQYSPDRSSIQQDASAASKKAVERYPLPTTLYMVQYGAKIPVNSEHFGGKERVTAKEVIDFLKQDFPIFRSPERKADIFFDRNTHTLSVAAISGKKGYRRLRYAGRKSCSEDAHTGIFKLIRTKEELEEVCKKDYYFGNYVGDSGASVSRIENLPIGIFTLHYGERFSVKSVGFKSKLRKLPIEILEEVLSYFREDLSKEAICQIWYDRENDTFEIKYPSHVVSTKSEIDYEFIGFEQKKVLFMTIHSHNTFEARFSRIDDADEVATGLYGVIGTLDKEPTFRFRAGIMGCFKEIPIEQLFEVSPVSVYKLYDEVKV